MFGTVMDNPQKPTHIQLSKYWKMNNNHFMRHLQRRTLHLHVTSVILGMRDSIILIIKNAMNNIMASQKGWQFKGG